jgi:hypothetical protein
MMNPRSIPLAPLAAAALLLLVSAAPSTAAEPTTAPTAQVVTLGAAPQAKAHLWLETSLNRVFPHAPPGSADLSLLAPRNGRVAFQVCARNDHTALLYVDCKIVGADDLKPQVRFVGLVPVPHLTPGTDASELDGARDIPGLVPDPLFPLSSVHVGPRETRSFWITLTVPPDAQPGRRQLTARLTVRSGGPQAKATDVDLPVTLDVSPFVVQPRRDFPVAHWWRGEATWDYYKTGMFDERWWQITRAQLEDMLAHGSDVVYVPVFFNRRETFRRPCQLLVVNEPSPGNYDFDWARVKRFTDLCRQIGFTKFEWSHLWIYWGVKNPIRVYTEKQPGKYEMLWPPDTGGFSDTYVGFLKQFLPAFHDFLTREDLLDHSYFHLSDEPAADHIENYRKARHILRDLAPWMKTMDALSDIRYGREGVTDMPIPIVSSAQAYIDAKLPHWVYYCCSPTGPWLNRFCDTPLPKIRMSGWLFYRLRARGFLHWGFNYWHKIEREELADPFTDLTAAAYPDIPAGDPFMIYPGPDGKPIDSLRWEVFAESLQDYAILQTAGIDPDDPLLAEIKSYKDFPRDGDWIRRATEKVLRRTAPPATAPAAAGQ